MRYWWVNQSGSHKIEHSNGFMWSPRFEAGGKRNQAYDNMKLLQPGDRIFSNVDGHIVAVGTIQSTYYPSLRPDEFPPEQNKGNVEGWRVDVSYNRNVLPLRHSNHADTIRPLLPTKYSPIDINGKAAMKLYLTSISNELALELVRLIKLNEIDFPNLNENELELVIENQIIQNETLTMTERKALVAARIGQGKFKERVKDIEKGCRLTGIDDMRFLIASHIKPWRDSTNEERLDGANGLLLTPNADKLFDNFYISFNDDGSLLISNNISAELLVQLGLPISSKNLPFNEHQKKYLAYHRSKLK